MTRRIMGREKIAQEAISHFRGRLLPQEKLTFWKKLYASILISLKLRGTCLDVFGDYLVGRFASKTLVFCYIFVETCCMVNEFPCYFLLEYYFWIWRNFDKNTIFLGKKKCVVVGFFIFYLYIYIYIYIQKHR